MNLQGRHTVVLLAFGLVDLGIQKAQRWTENE